MQTEIVNWYTLCPFLSLSRHSSVHFYRPLVIYSSAWNFSQSIRDISDKNTSLWSWKRTRKRRNLISPALYDRCKHEKWGNRGRGISKIGSDLSNIIYKLCQFWFIDIVGVVIVKMNGMLLIAFELYQPWSVSKGRLNTDFLNNANKSTRYNLGE